MARHETDREDLMQEATALTRRCELLLPGIDQTVVAGLRGSGGLSVCFGADPVYHFDEALRLRRAYVDGLLYRTQGPTLARLARRRTGSATELIRHDLNEAELTRFRAEMCRRLEALTGSLRADQVPLLKSVPEEDDLRPELLESIDRFLAAGAPLAPAIKGKGRTGLLEHARRGQKILVD